MFEKVATWLALLQKVGNTRQKAEQQGQFFRYFVYEMLSDAGLFEYLREPRTYEEIADNFGFADKDYTQSVLEVLVKDKHPLLSMQDGMYQSVPSANLPALSELADQTDKGVRNFSLMAKGMAHYVLPRMRNEKIEFPETFVQDGRNLLAKFDTTLRSNIYTDLRAVTFARLSRKDYERLRGKQLLEIGCGSGRETAEIWLRFGGKVHITGIDPVESLLALARERFADHLDELEPGHPPLTMANKPTFYKFDGTKLPFEDNTFDAAYHAFVLHWTSDPSLVIREITRVLKPGGIMFGIQPCKPMADLYFDLVVRATDSFGYFWKDEFLQWHANEGVNLDITTPMTVFRGYKPDQKR